MKKLINYILNQPIIFNFIIHFLSKEKQIKIYTHRIRNEMLLWGYDLSQTSDDQIIEGLTNFSKVLSKTGLSSNEAARSLKPLII